jgi:hypothetical protein
VCACVCLVKRCKCVSEASSVDTSVFDPGQPSLSLTHACVFRMSQRQESLLQRLAQKKASLQQSIDTSLSA